MKFLIVFVALFAIAVARPNDVHTVREDASVEPEGFKFGYETSDGSSQDAEGKLKDVGSEHETLVVHGSYTWVDKEGHSHTINYVADEHGYQATGDDVPKDQH